MVWSRFLATNPALTGQKYHLGRAIPDRPGLPEGLKVADQDRGMHERHEMRAPGPRVRVIDCAAAAALGAAQATCRWPKAGLFITPVSAPAGSWAPQAYSRSARDLLPRPMGRLLPR